MEKPSCVEAKRSIHGRDLRGFREDGR